MNPLSAKFLGSVYRKEPISGFILILGLTDAVIGGVGGRWSLFSVGITIALLALLARWRQLPKRATEAVASKPVRSLLPPHSSRPELPLLMSNKRH